MGSIHTLCHSMTDVLSYHIPIINHVPHVISFRTMVIPSSSVVATTFREGATRPRRIPVDPPWSPIVQSIPSLCASSYISFPDICSFPSPTASGLPVCPPKVPPYPQGSQQSSSIIGIAPYGVLNGFHTSPYGLHRFRIDRHRFCIDRHTSRIVSTGSV
jgi:hypothetical protein